MTAEASAQAADNVYGAQADASLCKVVLLQRKYASLLFKLGVGIGSLASFEVGVMGKVGVQAGAAIASLDLGIIGGEIGKNGIRLSTPIFSIRLFGSA